MRRRHLFLTVFLLALVACTVPAIRTSDISGLTVRATAVDAGLVDSRAAFSRVFCDELYRHPEPADPRECRAWLHGELQGAGPSETTAPGTLPATRPVVVIPGIFGECVADYVTPFSNDYDLLRGLGYRVHVIPVTGRGSSAQNAKLIQAYFSDPANDLDGAVVVAYSKGLTDFMVAAAAPEAAPWRARVAALVSMAGVANGSPLANHGERLYRRLLSRFPLEACPEADRGGPLSLTHREAMVARAGFDAAAPDMPRYAIAAISRRGEAHPVLDASYDLLAKLDARNDGQVLVEDALLPGGTVLAVVDANHWSVALPFRDSKAPLMAPLAAGNVFPRRALILATLRMVGPVQGHALAPAQDGR
jgi:hypothetical protein